jgi:hypothetical protein
MATVTIYFVATIETDDVEATVQIASEECDTIRESLGATEVWVDDVEEDDNGAESGTDGDDEG